VVVAKIDRPITGGAAQFEKTHGQRYLQGCGFTVCPMPTTAPCAGSRRQFRSPQYHENHHPNAPHQDRRQKQAGVSRAPCRHAARIVEAVAHHSAASPASKSGWKRGATHQIRVASPCGHALVGDPTYGGGASWPLGAISDAAAQVVRAFPRQALAAQVLLCASRQRRKP